MVTDYYGLKRIKKFINQINYGLTRTFEEVEMVPIIGVEPPTFTLRMKATPNYAYIILVSDGKQLFTVDSADHYKVPEAR